MSKRKYKVVNNYTHKPKIDFFFEQRPNVIKISNKYQNYERNFLDAKSSW